MAQLVWISFDFGIKGDYDNLYRWLDNHQAKECGQSLAVIKYEDEDNRSLGISLRTLIDKLKQELADNVNLEKGDRIYIIWKDAFGKIKGEFIYGKRKAPLWKGYADIYDDPQSIDEL